MPALHTLPATGRDRTLLFRVRYLYRDLLPFTLHVCVDLPQDCYHGETTLPGLPHCAITIPTDCDPTWWPDLGPVTLFPLFILLLF